MEADKQKDFYVKLKAQLEDTSSWPATYLYKFIVPTEGTGVKEVEAVFDNEGAVVTKKQSKNGKYTSVTISLIMKNPDAVIEKYKLVGKVENVISL
ncbi:DUF493 domain-containing protein [Cellulophaga baltica]|uniref:DUF493 family protein n=1 Tax=Cellulophaga TaxID=104264 RepID=UPI001C0693AA|nr:MULTISPECIES: DUF493 family protein [Cellulophaga]MBU2997327.1 DUF493 domain-containing protein [Cellulophaga baltica]MDO6768725.1 DUF493 family protein [Cellulophaga sp. 1_MG-2023]